MSPGPDARQEQETQIRFPGPPVARTGDTKRNGAFKPASGKNRKRKQISGPASKARTENTAMNHSHGSIRKFGQLRNTALATGVCWSHVIG